MTALLYGLQVMIVGLLIVFAGLTILIGCIKVMEIVMVRFSAPKEKKAVNPNSAAAPVADQQSAELSPVKDDAELIAVITAAVAAMMAQEDGCAPEEEVKGFVVRTIRRVSNAPAWNRAGREEQIYSRA